MTSPLLHEPRDSAFLTSIIAEPEIHRPPLDSIEQERIPATCEHCSRRCFLEDSLRKSQRQRDLEFDRINREKAELLGKAVHDLRLPIATIQIYGELLAEGIDGAANAELMEWVDSIRSVSEFALRLLDETVGVAIADSGTSELHTEPTILASIIAKSLSIGLPQAARKHIRLTLIQDDKPQPVLMDPVKMSKVFNNLIENAIKYCHPGARIEVRVSHREDSVWASVRDDGPGIAPSDLKTLFTPFQRTRARAVCAEPSAGLGLSIVKRIVDLHGGRIWVKSEVSKGTTFYVSLPTQVLPPAKRS